MTILSNTYVNIHVGSVIGIGYYDRIIGKMSYRYITSPVILLDLCGLLIRFRMYPYIVLADIERAFLQVGMCEEDRDVTRFLWLEDTGKVDVEDNLATYRFYRLPFDVNCSPFLLAATIKFHLQKEGTPLALKSLDDIYVDNILVGASCYDESLEIYKEAKSNFKRAAMNLRQWSSNCHEFMEALPDGEKSFLNIVNVLGLLWNQNEDTFCIPGGDRMCKSDKTTKRDVLHYVSKIFDP